MASRKEEKDRLRQQRMEAERRASADQRRRLMLGYVVAGLLGIAVLAGIVFAVANSGGEGGQSGGDDGSENVNTNFGFLPNDVEVDERDGTEPPEVENGDLVGAANVAGCDLQQDLEDEGNTHFTNEDKTVDYKTNPPTSGDHFFNPNETGTGALADGAFLDTPPMNRVVHSLEHGRIAIQYDPDLPEEDQLALKGLFDEARGGIMLFPNADMPYAVAATAWTQLVGCKTYDDGATLDVLRDFRDQYLGQGPEGVAF